MFASLEWGNEYGNVNKSSNDVIKIGNVSLIQ